MQSQFPNDRHKKFFMLFRKIFVSRKKVERTNNNKLRTHRLSSKLACEKLNRKILNFFKIAHFFIFCLV